MDAVLIFQLNNQFAPPWDVLSISNVLRGGIMPILSYLVLPRDGAMDQLCTDLSTMEYCEIIPADNQEVVVLVTDTPDEKIEKNLQESLKNLPSLHSISMTFGHSAE